ncbi:MAG: hypothetical protein LBN23_04300 [Paludibacter sp.]|jgi:hypothetical protein|nr:hypothetical protein [Paludibacter sp.]
MELNKKKMFVDIADNIAIIINSETGIYYGMNNFGTSVFENIIKGASTDAILTEINKVSGVPADISARFTTFIEKLKSTEILIDSNAPVTSQVSLNADFAVADNFVLEISEYADAQELLLADPIHDVDEELGWQPVLKDVE